MNPHPPIPTGAQLAAEAAWAKLTPTQRRDRQQVARALLEAAVPFLGPAVAQLGQCRIGDEEAKAIFRLWLAGSSTAELANRYAVTKQTINKHLRRAIDRTRVRLVAGVSVLVIARENQTTPAAVVAAIDSWRFR